MQNENGVLAVQEDFGNALVDKYAPVWDKKYRSKGESIWVFQRRTLSSACQVATTLHDMDFGKASTFLFHLVREAEECKPIIEAVSSQVELAMANSDKFIKGYHRFLQELTKPAIIARKAMMTTSRCGCSTSPNMMLRPKTSMVSFATCLSDRKQANVPS